MHAGELRNQVTVHRPTESPDDFGDVIRGWEDADGPHWMSIMRDGGDLRDTGPGEQPAPVAKAKCYSQVDVRPRDVVRVTEGPEAGTVWKVVESFDEGRGERVMRMEAYAGPPP